MQRRGGPITLEDCESALELPGVSVVSLVRVNAGYGLRLAVNGRLLEAIILDSDVDRRGRRAAILTAGIRALSWPGLCLVAS